jgi:hypothetical protein
LIKILSSARSPTESELPSQSLDPVWISIEPGIAKVTKLPDGRWQAIVPSLPPGYNKVRLLAKAPGAQRLEGSEFNIFVGEIPLPPPLSWLPSAFLFLCSGYLLRKNPLLVRVNIQVSHSTVPF